LDPIVGRILKTPAAADRSLRLAHQPEALYAAVLDEKLDDLIGIATRDGPSEVKHTNAAGVPVLTEDKRYLGTLLCDARWT
jgi:hypothetical protein